jgi:transposase
MIMAEKDRIVIGGADTHKDSFHMAAIDGQGRRLGCRPFAAAASGYKEALRWLRSLGEPSRVGIECTGSYGAGLAAAVRRAGLEAWEVYWPDKQERRRRGKDDWIDAYAAAGAALSGQRCCVAKATSAALDGLRALKAVYDSCTKAQVAAKNSLQGMVVTCDEPLRTELRGLGTEALVKRCAAFRRGKDGVRSALRLVGRRAAALGKERDELAGELDCMTRQLLPQTRAIFGVGPQTAVVLALAAGADPTRLAKESSFAALCGASPVSASSGKTEYMRLSRGGNRKANSALHRIALTRVGRGGPDKGFYERKLAEGKGTMGALRCAKRYAARKVFGPLSHDLAAIGAIS